MATQLNKRLLWCSQEFILLSAKNYLYWSVEIKWILQLSFNLSPTFKMQKWISFYREVEILKDIKYEDTQ